MNLKQTCGLALALSFVLFAHVPAKAESTLQLYVEGATYNFATESWELAPPGSSGGAPFRLWAIGNVSGPGGVGDIDNVRLSAAYDAAAGDIQFTLTPSTTLGYGGYTDPSTPDAPIFLQIVTDGSSPVLGDGKSLPSHGIYGPGVFWQEFLLGDFTAPGDSPHGDFIDSFPTPSVDLGAQINVYEIMVTGPMAEHPVTIHFDLYDTIEASNHATFSPFSHDADVTIVPEPSSLALLGIGAFSLFGARFYRRRRQTCR